MTTAVTCPTMRIHPAILAQATATSSNLLPDGRFRFGVGTGEALNEHILGDRWPPADLRLSMLAEAIELIRRLWTGEQVTHRGEHYTVENARIYTPPSSEIPIVVSAFGPVALAVAAEHGDGWMTTGPDADMLRPVPGRRRQGPDLRGHQGLLGRGRGHGPQAGPRDLADQRRARASSTRTCRRRPTSSRPRRT